MALFTKTGVTLLQELLEQVKGGIYILSTKYEKKGNRLYIAYGTVANSEKQPAPFSGISVNVRVLKEEDLVVNAETETIKINGKEAKVSQNIVRLFWDIISELSAELESRIQKILTPSKKSTFIVKSIDMIEPFTIESRSASVRVELTLSDRRYQEELPPFQIFYMGSKGLFNYLLLRNIQHLCSQEFLLDGKTYVEIPTRSLSGNIPKFLHALSEVGALDVLLEDEDSIKLKLEAMQKKVLGFVKKSGAQIGIEKSYLMSDGGNEYLISGLELAYVVFLLLGTPGRVPITILTWVLDELADDVVKDRLKELNLEVFFGDEERLFKGLVEDQPDEDLLEGINSGFHTNLFEMKVDDAVKSFKKSIQKTIQKYDNGNLIEKKKKKKDDKQKIAKKSNKKQAVETKQGDKSLKKAFALFPTFDSAEKELRIREFAKEITICFVSELEENVDKEDFKEAGHGVLSAIRKMFELHIIWASNGWVYFQPGTEDQMSDRIGKGVYAQILNWPYTRERLIKNRWGLNSEYDVVSFGDIFSVFKKEKLSGVMIELDNLFSIKRLFVRHMPEGLQTWKRRKSEGEEQLLTLQMLEPLVLTPIKRKGMGLFWLKFKLHRMIKKMKGSVVLHGDLLRNIDFLDDILFIFNSRFGLEVPNSLLIEEIMTDLRALEAEGLLKRYLLSQHAVTSTVIKIPPKLSERKALLLQMIPVIANRYNF